MANPEASALAKIDPRSLAIPVSLASVWIFFAAMNPQFLSARNLSMLMIELSVTATLAVGMLLIIVPGHIDLSAGSGVGLLGGVAAVLTTKGQVPASLALGVALGLGMILWATMGLAIVRLKIQAFIITLGGLLIFKGLFWLVIRSSTVPVLGSESSNLYSMLTTWYLPPRWGIMAWLIVVIALAWSTLRNRRTRSRALMRIESKEEMILRLLVIGQALLLVVLVCNLYRGIPLPLIILISLAAVADWLTRNTPFGRYLYAIGGNEQAASACGVPVDRTILTAFVIMGGIVALTGFMQTSYAGASTTTVGELMELDAIAACVIGGASLRGGRGTVLGAILGALIMASLLNGMTLQAVTPEIKLMIRGAVLVVAVVMDVRLRRKGA
ncbi:MAG TPA: hypothetical protein PJ982_19520 [Lacipirellulaceae bacterium]|mgnify:FL=1|nr:hypothetical protein [Lacipirellulaceae bacterium]